MGRGKHLTGKLEGESEILTHEEVLRILSEMARKGSVTAAATLERCSGHRRRSRTSTTSLSGYSVVTTETVYERRFGWLDRLRRRFSREHEPQEPALDEGGHPTIVVV